MNNEQLQEILKDSLLSNNIQTDVNITGATTNLQLALESDICFYKIHDSNEAEQAFRNRLKKSSCKNIITNKDIKIDGVNTWVIDEDKFLETQKKISDKIYPNSGKLKIVGITGTNGKTTCTFLSMQLATQNGLRSISIGTIGVRSIDEILEKDILSTTPSYLELRKIINKYQDDYDVIFLEVSSHALVQNRLYDLKLEIGAWTSFSQDHLDYHSTIEEYFLAKASMVNLLINKDIIVPSSEIDLVKKLENQNLSVDIVKPYYSDELSVGFKATYNQANLAISKRIVERVLKKEINITSINLPDGRFEPIEFRENIFLVDYAHTPDALENICRTIKKDFSDYDLIVVFGCGGDRDRAKRPLMGSAVSRYADKVIVTSDNPRTEDPKQIIEDTISGISISFIKEPDRKLAIKKAISIISKKSVILVAGKGHEDYQEINGVKYDFSDSKVIQELIKE